MKKRFLPFEKAQSWSLKHPQRVLLLLYFIFSITTLLLWGQKSINLVTGDEPHYLVMASGIVKHASLEQTQPYREEFKTKAIYPFGLAPQDAEPSPMNTHAVAGPHGLFNVHNIGLPLLLSIPFLLGGVLGAKLFMILCGAFVVVFNWKFASVFSQNKQQNLWVVLATSLSLPLIPASNQIYPDLLAGLISLIGLYWFMTTQQNRSKMHEIVLTSIIVFLPWLQIKLAATCIIIVLAVVVKLYSESRDIPRILRICLVASASLFLLAFYNNYAFGKLSGPYQDGALELSKTSLMVLFGLFFDQNQGFLIQNPINLIGLLAIGWLYKIDRPFAIVWGLVFLSLIVPNALHPVWYGGGSFSGRFVWAAALVFIVPTSYALLLIGKSREAVFQWIVTAGVLLQLYFFYQYAIEGLKLYNKEPTIWFDNYSIFFFSVHSWLPMLYNSKWAFEYIPNYAWFVVISSLLLIGFIPAEKLVKKTAFLFAFFVALLLTAGLYKAPQVDNKRDFQANELPSQTGKIINSTRFAEHGIDQPGFLNYGPYFALRKGTYEVVLMYSSSGENTEEIGSFDIFDATAHIQTSKVSLHGTNSTNQNLQITFQVKRWNDHPFEFRTYWNGSSNLKIHDIFLQKIN